MEEQEIIIKRTVFNEVVRYMLGRPYAEVVELINKINSSGRLFKAEAKENKADG